MIKLCDQLSKLLVEQFMTSVFCLDILSTIGSNVHCNPDPVVKPFWIIISEDFNDTNTIFPFLVTSEKEEIWRHWTRVDRNDFII